MDNNQIPVQPQNSNKNTYAIVALVLGLIGIVGSIIPTGGSIVLPLILLVCSILAIVFGAKGMKVAKSSGQGKGLAVAGLVLGIISVSFTVVALICVIIAAAALGAVVSGLSAFII